ncbi:hypothetical protein A3J78_01295 [Candidatus Beckwithbacteria bacterium RBG_13_35_6]|uniref:Uncharacterized protein n=1 Tax=Candidatus Beckwithbacteria bacterium RBG_13_35_6 TaxID=1797456 RepID=A0A1F5DFM3_9BACT|nr:MAG: hypothetical protein A3J78_01295 [Candidatus Beckwithbacteria bacterium RBG_13_35_6]
MKEMKKIFISLLTLLLVLLIGFFWVTNTAYAQNDCQTNADCPSGYYCRLLADGFGGFIGTCLEDISGCNYFFDPANPSIDDINSLTLTITYLEPNQNYILSIGGPGTLNCSQTLKSNAVGVISVSNLGGISDLMTCITQNGTFDFILEKGTFRGIAPNICEFSLTLGEDEFIIEILKPTRCVYTTIGSPPTISYGIKTALGCFPIEPRAIVEWFLKYGIIFGGGIAFLLMLLGAFQIITSSGDPERLKKGQEVLFSALAGLLLIIFSVFILRFIGVTILKLPGWG